MVAESLAEGDCVWTSGRALEKILKRHNHLVRYRTDEKTVQYLIPSADCIPFDSVDGDEMKYTPHRFEHGIQNVQQILLYTQRRLRRGGVMPASDSGYDREHSKETKSI